MSKLGWLTRIGGFAAAPFTGGWSIPASQIGASAIESKQRANDAAKGGSAGIGGGHPEDPSLQILRNLGTGAQQQGAQFGQQSQEAIQPALQYLQALTGNNPAALMEATRAERGTVMDQYDAARKAIANFGPRGGGTTSTLAQSRFDQAESLSDITSTARRNAVASESQLGVSLAGLGLTAQDLATRDISEVVQAVLAREGLNVQQRGQNMGLLGDIGQTIGTLVGIWMGRDSGGGSNQPAGVSGGTIGNRPIYG